MSARIPTPATSRTRRIAPVPERVGIAGAAGGSTAGVLVIVGDLVAVGVVDGVAVIEAVAV